MNNKKIRNFSIIAHVDHGKSTLADRLLDRTGAFDKLRKKKDQFLDKMDLERERGITIKAQTVRLDYTTKDGEELCLNLIDTPGHVDFSYEVSRSLAACEGAVLVVDAAQGVQAQTLANAYLAADQDLVIVPVLNKIDLPGADAERAAREIEEIVGISAQGALAVSAKTGIGIDEVLAAVAEEVPPPEGDPDAPLQALIFDSWFDNYLGSIALVRIFQGTLKEGDRISMMSTGQEFEVTRLGYMSPEFVGVKTLSAGEVGLVSAGIKTVKDTRIGDTITTVKNQAPEPLPGFTDAKPNVFSGLYPADGTAYEDLRTALEKLVMNDASIQYEPETSAALGFGFRLGYLGLLHMEIVQERLEREFGLELITTAPTVKYRVHKKDGEVLEIDNPAKLPDPQFLEYIEEPVILATIHVPAAHVGKVLQLCEDRRGTQKDFQVVSEHVIVKYQLPLNEIVLDFHDRLKSLSRGYATFDYEIGGFVRSDLSKLDILINGDPVDALSIIVHKERAYTKGRELASKMREIIPRQMYEVAIQASIGNRIIARESVRALRKNVTAKCYGGDITRKRKLLEKQKEGKKRMKRMGSVDIPQDAFLAILKVGE